MRKLLALAVLALIMTVVGLGSGQASAATILVDDDLVQCPTAAHTNIQAAVNAASPGDIIQVCAGTYLEPTTPVSPLTINKTLTLRGVQAGVDARTRVGAESIINDIQGTNITASNVVLDGFSVQGAIAPFLGFGVAMAPGTSGTQILNNIIQNNIVGIGLGGSNVTIRHNLIRNNNSPGAASGTGIYTDEFVGGSTIRNILIEENTFSGHDDAGVDSSNTDPAGGVFGLDVDTNSFTNNGRMVVLFNTHDSTIHDNTSTGATLVGSADVRIFDRNTNLSVLRNNLSNGVGHAIRTSVLFGTLLGPSSGLEIHFNNIEVFALTGLTVTPLSHTGTVDAECNWWNSSSGPFAATNPTGTGEEVVGDADFTPWLIARYPAPCIGGVPSTPGKVTGGGQVAGQDPLFSPLGDLISLPALMVSTSGGSQANFGFVIQFASGDPAPKGNLVYNDHDGTQIKATSYDTLIIANGLCGMNTHATFTGTANVNGVSEALTVEVDDCGEPSSGPPPDTFKITTDSYSNGGPLIGGNIQIH